MMLALLVKHTDIVELLDPTDNKGVTRLMQAVECGIWRL
eukprot:XP_001708668.1 Hypothetical protein GL50803_29646 [Giardia lamblia ATCC 50803]